MKPATLFVDTLENTEPETAHHFLSDSVEEAKTLYNIMAARFLDLNTWHEMMKPVSLRFYVNNSFNIHVQRQIATGDYIRLESEDRSLPKWLYIDEVSDFSNEQTQITTIYLHASQNPFEHATHSLMLSRTESLINMFAAPDNELLHQLQWKLLSQSILQRPTAEKR